MGILEQLKRLFRKERKESTVTAGIGTKEETASSSIISIENQIRELDKEIEEHQQQIEKLKTHPPHLKPFKYTPSKPRQPASQTYTGKKVRGLPPQSARTKRMWKLQVSKEELEKAAEPS